MRGKSQAEVTRKVRKLEQERDAGMVSKPGKKWTVQSWLAHWVENIAAPSIRESSAVTSPDWTINSYVPMRW